MQLQSNIPGYNLLPSLSFWWLACASGWSSSGTWLSQHSACVSWGEVVVS